MIVGQTRIFVCEAACSVESLPACCSCCDLRICTNVSWTWLVKQTVISTQWQVVVETCVCAWAWVRGGEGSDRVVGRVAAYGGSMRRRSDGRDNPSYIDDADADSDKVPNGAARGKKFLFVVEDRRQWSYLALNTGPNMEWLVEECFLHDIGIKFLIVEILSLSVLRDNYFFCACTFDWRSRLCAWEIQMCVCSMTMYKQRRTYALTCENVGLFGIHLDHNPSKRFLSEMWCTVLGCFGNKCCFTASSEFKCVCVKFLSLKLKRKLVCLFVLFVYFYLSEAMSFWLCWQNYFVKIEQHLKLLCWMDFSNNRFAGSRQSPTKIEKELLVSNVLVRRNHGKMSDI